METKKLTPDQVSAITKARECFQTATDAVKDGLEILESNGLQDHFVAIMSLQVDNVKEDGSLDETVAVNRVLHGNADDITEVLAYTAADQDTPWLVKALKQAASEAVVIKTFDTAKDLRELLGK